MSRTRIHTHFEDPCIAAHFWPKGAEVLAEWMAARLAANTGESGAM